MIAYSEKLPSDHPQKIYDLTFDGADCLKNFSDIDFEAWLEERKNSREGIDLPEGSVPATDFLVMRKDDNHLVGILQVRQELAQGKEIRGHFGYSVSPDERGKGLGDKILGQALFEFQKLGIKEIYGSCACEQGFCKNNAEK